MTATDSLRWGLELLAVLAVGLTVNHDAKARDVTEHLESLGNPAKEWSEARKAAGGKNVGLYARNPWDLKAFDGQLFVGIGNSSNGGPHIKPRRMPLISLNPLTAEWTEEYLTSDEQVDVFYVFGDELLVPGHDPLGPDGWLYRRKKGQGWHATASLKDVIHVYGLYPLAPGRMLAATGSRETGLSSAGAYYSSNDGVTWTYNYTGGWRAHSFLAAGRESDQFGGC